MKVPVTATTLRTLADQAARSGTQEKFIELALDWADEAERIALHYEDTLREIYNDGNSAPHSARLAGDALGIK